MNHRLQKLNGAKLLRAARLDDSLMLSFDADRLLAIHNRWRFFERSKPRLALEDVARLIGGVVTAVRDETDSTCLHFGEFRFCIDLSDSAWMGPEAAVLYQGGIPLVVWN